VSTVTSSADKVGFLKSLGADEVIVSTDGNSFFKDPALAGGVRGVARTPWQAVPRSSEHGGIGAAACHGV